MDRITLLYQLITCQNLQVRFSKLVSRLLACSASHDPQEFDDSRIPAFFRTYQAEKPMSLKT
jgi:hypothetical protein